MLLSNYSVPNKVFRKFYFSSRGRYSTYITILQTDRQCEQLKNITYRIRGCNLEVFIPKFSLPRLIQAIFMGFFTKNFFCMITILLLESKFRNNRNYLRDPAKVSDEIKITFCTGRRIYVHKIFFNLSVGRLIIVEHLKGKF